jgi:hypothetical protein
VLPAAGDEDDLIGSVTEFFLQVVDQEVDAATKGTPTMRNALAALTLSAVAFGATGAKADFCNDKVSELVNQQLASQYQTTTADIQDMMAGLEAFGKQKSNASTSDRPRKCVCRILSEGNAGRAAGHW